MKTYRRFLRFLRPYSIPLTVNIIGSTLFSFLSGLSIYLVQPLFQLIFPKAVSSPMAIPQVPTGAADVWKRALTDWVGKIVVGDTVEATLVHLCLLIVTVFLLKNAIKYVSDILMAYVSNGVIRDIRNTVFGKLLSLSLGYFHRQRTGVLISRVTNDVTVLNDALAPLFSVLVHEPLQIALYLGILLMISWKLTLVAAATSVLMLLVIRFLGKWIRRYSARIQARIGDVTASLQEALQNIRIIKAYGAEQSEVGKFSRHTNEHFRAGMKYWRTSHLTSPINEVLAISALVIVLYNGGHLVFAGSVTPADLMLFIVTLFAIMSPVNTVAGLYMQVQRGLAAADTIAEVMDEQPTVASGAELFDSFQHQIVLKGLSFAYDRAPAVTGIDLTIRRGETIALVGPSGSGKSTLADLVLRFYDPQQGSIAIDGRDIRSLDLVPYRRLFGVVTQEAMLFNDTVRANIGYAMPEATEEQIRAAARIANAEEFILRMPKGFDTTIGDRGTQLSGGERQRLAIARAVLRDPAILIFDEATSALDSQSELVVQQAIERLLANRTAIIIAHRLSTVQMADTIVVLEQGRIVQTGTHAELVQEGGLYRKLHEIQTGYR
jgi:subfamily B ATP-binding cassette protein MsbA